ncbi:MAG: hypothetical protein VKK04_13895 [Synechococcales bacterium]|nr:hypothetical protein [Synechococcales bacterium]
MCDRRAKSRRRLHPGWVVGLAGVVGWLLGIGGRPTGICVKPFQALLASPPPLHDLACEARPGPGQGGIVLNSKSLVGLGLGAAAGLVFVGWSCHPRGKPATLVGEQSPSLLTQYLLKRQMPLDALCSSEAQLTPLQREILQGLLVLGAIRAPYQPGQRWRYGEVRSLLMGLGFSDAAIGGVWQIIGESPPSEDISLRA